MTHIMRLVVLGDPVTHSLSPRIQQAAFDEAGIPGIYTARRVDAAGMEQALAELRRGELDGANVTMPHKRLASRLVDQRAPDAERSESVNTIVRDLGSLIGHSTDVGGIRSAWSENGLPERAPVLLLGGGGAAAAALLALEGSEIFISTRRRGAGRALLERVGVAGEEVPWGVAVPGAVVANATPIGMYGESLPPGLLEQSIGLLDMAYAATPTPAVRLAAGLRLPVADGLAMLVGQAALSFQLWTGRTGPVQAMRRAVETAQGA
jgi:shikimate dehydrogenase